MSTYEVKSPEQLAKDATAQVSAEIGAEVQPFESSIATERDRKDRAVKDLEALFGGLLPYVAGSAQRVTETYSKGQAAIKDIYATAQARLSELKQSQAQKAQALAQEIGGPVAVSEFTASTAAQEAQFPHAAAGAELHALGNAQAGSQLAEAFAGRVFPVMRVEEEVRTRAKFDDQIRELTEKIATIKASKVGRINERLTSLQEKERNFELQKTQQQLDRLKADRDWQVARAQLKQNRAQAAREIERIRLERAGILGYIEKRYKDKKGKWHTQRTPTLGGRQLNEQILASVADRTGYTTDPTTGAIIPTPVTTGQKIDLKKLNAEIAAGKREMSLAAEDKAQELTDAFMSPVPTTVKSTKYSEVNKETFIADGGDPASLILDAGPDGKAGTKDDRWYSAKDVTEQVVGQSLTNPKEIYLALIGKGTPPPIALKVVRDRFNDPKWKPNQAARDDVRGDKPGDTVGPHFRESELKGKSGAWMLSQAAARGFTTTSSAAARKFLLTGKRP